MNIKNESNIRYLRVILTNLCNLKCEGCHQEGQMCFDEMKGLEAVKIISTCIRAGIRKVKLMGGEPTLHHDLLQIIKSVKNVDNTVDLSLISNGTADIDLYKSCFDMGLDRLNLSIHGFNKKYFVMNTQSSLLEWKLMRNNLDYLCKNNMINKINYVLKKGINETDLNDLIIWLSQYSDKRIDILNYLTINREESSLIYSMQELEYYLEERFGIVDKNEVQNPYSLKSTHVLLTNGILVNLKTSELRNARFLRSCETCKIKEFCTEGICAVRLCTDYRIQPCLFRNDNCFFADPKSESLEEDIIEYFNDL